MVFGFNAVSTRGVRAAVLSGDPQELILTMTDGTTVNLGRVQGKGIDHVEVLSTGELKFYYDDGSDPLVVGEDVYSALNLLKEAAEDARDDAVDAKDAAVLAQTAAETAQSSAASSASSALTYRNSAQDYANISSNMASRATDAKDAAVYAQGKAEDAQELAEAWAAGTTGETPTATNNAKYYSQQAASDSSDAEAYAAGTRGGVDVSSDDPAYENNSAYYADQAATSAATFETDTTLSVEGKAADAKATGDALDDVKSVVFSLLNTDATTIPDETDLNTLTTPGNYKVNSSARAATMINAPTTAVGYRLLVFQTNSSSAVFQLAFLNTGANSTKIAIRSRPAETWCEWLKIADRGYVDTQVSAISAALDVLEGKVIDTQTDIAPMYSTSATYAIGDYCIYNGSLYRCITTISPAEAWTSAHWKEVALGDDVADLKTVVDDTDETVDFVSMTTGIDNETINGVTVNSETDGTLKLYGVPSATRYFLCLNGQKAAAASTYSFHKTLGAGTYEISAEVSGYATTLYWNYTYTTFGSGTRLIQTGSAPIRITFTEPVMIALYMSSSSGNFGTSSNPTYVRLRATKLSAYDWVARSEASFSAMDAEILADGTDLNNVTTAGKYRVATSSSAATIENAPLTTTGYALWVVENSIPGRLTQIAFTNVAYDNPNRIFVRTYTGAWSAWQGLAGQSYVDSSIADALLKTMTASGITLTSSNYLTYFQNGSFNDAPLNSIYGISADVPLTDGPDGNDWIGYGAHSSTGYNRGILLTFRQYTVNSTLYSGVTQILIGYRSKSDGYKPTLSFRTAIVSSSTLYWSDWSKFTENAYLHSGNRVISAGRMDETVSDLNDLPQNVIYQIDRNCNGSTTEATLGHHPAPGESCIVSSIAFSYTTNHGQAQTVYARDGRMYWRYGYQNTSEEYLWTPWRRIATEIPDAPSNDGTYVLKCVVSDGTPTYSWVAEQ